MSKRRIHHLAALIATGGLMFVFAACGEPRIIEVVNEVPIETTKVVRVEVEKVRTVEVPVEKIVEKVVTKQVVKIVVATPTPTATPDPSVDPAECLESDEKYLLDLAARFSAFEIHVELAGSTPRLALANVVADMAGQKIDLVSIRPTNGCTGAYTTLASWMTTSIEGFSAFLAQRSDSYVIELLDAADEAKQTAAANINKAFESIGKPSILTVAGDAGESVEIAENPSTPAVQIVEGSLGFRVQERNNVWWKFAYQFELRNNTNRQQAVNMEIKFVDSDGYVVDDATAYDITIPANGTTVHSDSTLIDASEAPSVAGIHIEERR